MLNRFSVIAFVGTRDPGRAKRFYGETLGLPLTAEDGFALVFDANGTMLRVTLVAEVIPAKYTVLGWNVDDLEGTMRALLGEGVVFERYPGLKQDALGIWTAPTQARVAWFKDPDGNLLSLSTHTG